MAGNGCRQLWSTIIVAASPQPLHTPLPQSHTRMATKELFATLSDPAAWTGPDCVALKKARAFLDDGLPDAASGLLERLTHTEDPKSVPALLLLSETCMQLQEEGGLDESVELARCGPSSTVQRCSAAAMRRQRKY
jgi:hypothetical protein